jgi:AbiV family abortive infection protein
MNQHHKVTRYTGMLTPAMAFEGCRIAQENAKRLAEDARTLFCAGRFPAAAALATLSIEESGKRHILDHLVLAEDHAEAAAIWKRFRRHTEKNIFWSFQAGTTEGLMRRIETLFADDDKPKILETLKQSALYTDCIGAGTWISPTEIPEEIIKPFAEGLIKIADFHASLAPRSLRELELWVQNVKPANNQPPEARVQAIAGHFRHLQSEGLIPADIDVDQLIFGTIESE